MNLIYRFVLEIHFKIIFEHIYYYWCFDVPWQVSYKPCSCSLLYFFNKFQFIILYSWIVPMTEYHIHNWILISAHYFHLIHRIRLFAKYTKKEHLISGFLFWSIKILSNFFYPYLLCRYIVLFRKQCGVEYSLRKPLIN